jgi:histidinol phosphatase-like enzyme
LLAAHGARIDATYYCPHHPDIADGCGCRKPGTLLFDKAIADLDIDASASLFAGDRLRDVIPARTYGGTAFLVRAPSTPASDVDGAAAVGADVVESLGDAVRRFLVKAGRAR